MRLLVLFAPVAAASAAPAVAQTPPPPPITRDQALNLPAAELADIVFRQLGARMHSVSRPTFSGMLGNDGPVRGLTFATAPESAGRSGLCRATRIYVALDGARSGTASRAANLEAATVYKVIGEVDPGRESTDADEARLAEQCRRAGAVIPTETADLGQHVFFTLEGADSPVGALVALRRASLGARDGTYRNVRCTVEAPVGSPDCRDPAAALGALDLANLISIEVSRRGGSETRSSIEATFLISARSNEQSHWSVTLDADMSWTSNGLVLHLGRADLVRGILAID